MSGTRGLMSYQEVIAVYSETIVPEVAWQRAGLDGEPRATLGECSLRELYGLVTTKPETARGVAFVARAGEMIRYLESRADAAIS